jgi:hypothetical protein
MSMAAGGNAGCTRPKEMRSVSTKAVMVLNMAIV